MSISALIGSPGCGKSTALAYIANKQIKHPNKPIFIGGVCISEGHEKVYTNFEFHGAYKFDYKDLGKYNFHDCLILIDEMTMYSDSRDFKNFTDSLKFFYSQHRKFHVSLVWSSQAFDDSDKKIRNLTTQYFKIIPVCSFLSYFQCINAFTDIVNFNIVSGYEYGKKHYFLTKPIYKLFDSYQTLKIDKNTLPEPKTELWGVQIEDIPKENSEEKKENPSVPDSPIKLLV